MSVYTPFITSINDLFTSLFSHLNNYTKHLRDNDLANVVGDAKSRYITHANLGNLNDHEWADIMRKLYSSQQLSDEDLSDIKSLALELKTITQSFVRHEEEDLEIIMFEGRHPFDLFVQDSEKLQEQLVGLERLIIENLGSTYETALMSEQDKIADEAIRDYQEYLNNALASNSGEIDSLLDQGLNDDEAIDVFVAQWNKVFPSYTLSVPRQSSHEDIEELVSEHGKVVVDTIKDIFSAFSLRESDEYLLGFVIENIFPNQTVNTQALRHALYPVVERAVREMMKI